MVRSSCDTLYMHTHKYRHMYHLLKQTKTLHLKCTAGLCVFHMILTMISDNYTRLHSADGLSNGGSLCLLLGRKWSFKYHLLDLGSITGQSVCDCRQTELHWDRHFSTAKSLIPANTTPPIHCIYLFMYSGCSYQKDQTAMSENPLIKRGSPGSLQDRYV